MTPDQKRELKKRGKLIVEQRSAALHEALRQAIPSLSIKGFQTARANEEWFRKHFESIPAAEISRRFIVTSANDLGIASPFVECLSCHDVLHTYPNESTRCSCGSLTVTFRKPRRGLPPVVSARDDRARNVVLTAKGEHYKVLRASVADGANLMLFLGGLKRRHPPTSPICRELQTPIL